ncbi:unnamed protein product [Notodromas monacha]|uniref:Secreted protein n=1 Tax=Notodromas monacha TaxID=399045 RepID=A0A7R9GBL2_9CRUS|nr:unnamed protein product [Notodromas monacha]CAG0915112.1 unnamed protein product [Notodromas monacha]
MTRHLVMIASVAVIVSLTLLPGLISGEDRPKKWRSANNKDLDGRFKEYNRRNTNNLEKRSPRSRGTPDEHSGNNFCKWNKEHGDSVIGSYASDINNRGPDGINDSDTPQFWERLSEFRSRLTELNDKYASQNQSWNLEEVQKDAANLFKCASQVGLESLRICGDFAHRSIGWIPLEVLKEILASILL